mgnify:CR=1 FL=1
MHSLLLSLPHTKLFCCSFTSSVRGVFHPFSTIIENASRPPRIPVQIRAKKEGYEEAVLHFEASFPRVLPKLHGGCTAFLFSECFYGVGRGLGVMFIHQTHLLAFSCLHNVRWSDGMRCCRSDWPGLCLFCCYQPSCVVSQQILGYFGFSLSLSLSPLTPFIFHPCLIPPGSGRG